MSHRNYDSLRKAVLEKAKESMKVHVLPYVQTKMQDAMQDKVYDVYDPSYYERRGISGGLKDRDNIEGTPIRRVDPNGFDYRVDNIAKTNFGAKPQVYLAPLIVMGQAKASMYYDSKYLYDSYTAPYAQERDFITETIDRLDKKDLAMRLRFGFME